MSERKTAIELSSVDIGYGGPPVVEGVSLTVEEGEMHVLLGESGSGKTTILRALAGFEHISRGRISLFGETVDEIGEGPRSARRRPVPPEKRRVGVVFQDYALFPHLDVAGNVSFGMKRRDRARVAELLRRVGLGSLDRRHVAELSGGQQQRVALARALAQEPRIMLLDEPFSNLNRQLRDELRANTTEVLRAHGMTAVFVTHDRQEAFALADRISVIGDGRILQSGSSEQIYRFPTSEVVARSVGDINVIAAQVDESRDAVSCALGALPVRGPAEAGSACRVGLRPEQIRILQASSDSEASDVGQGTVERVIYCGAVDEVRLRLTDDTTVVAHVRPGSAKPGETVRLEVDGSVICFS